MAFTNQVSGKPDSMAYGNVKGLHKKFMVPPHDKF